MNAVKANDAAAVRSFIEDGRNVSAVDSAGDSPLIMAAYKGYTDIVKLLLDAGADIHALDPGMKATALHAAAYAGHAEAAKLLIEAGVEINRKGPYNGYTALHDAVWQNNIDVARVIIDAGADITIRSNEGQTPLDFARSQKHREIATMLEEVKK
jgi:ankyrin repeat protein